MIAKYDTNRNGKLDPDELAAMAADQKTKIPVETAPAPSATGDQVIALSPFEVISENKGYFSANSMSGTRMNSKIEDLGQSITVMTKEQMVDFAMLDINDVFDHMASTEGTGSYSQFDTDRTGAVVDQVSLNPNNANRVRGIGNANIAFNNIATTGRVPVDPLWMDSLELSRGLTPISSASVTLPAPSIKCPPPPTYPAISPAWKPVAIVTTAGALRWM